MRFTHFFFLLYFLIFLNCKEQQLKLTKIEGNQIQISDSLISDSDIEAFIKPYRDHLQKKIDSVLTYSKGNYFKTDGAFNTAIGNFMADAVYDRANPVFKSRTGHDIDMVLLNHGGIRSSISKGNITIKTAYELMPFENSIVVVELKGYQIENLVSYLIQSKQAHPVSKIKLAIDKNFNLIDYQIKGNKVDVNKTYYVATNDYLYNGGDNMTFFKPTDSLYVLNYKIRNAIIDTFIENDTINPVVDDRFIQIN